MKVGCDLVENYLTEPLLIKSDESEIITRGGATDKWLGNLRTHNQTAMPFPSWHILKLPNGDLGEDKL